MRRILLCLLLAALPAARANEILQTAVSYVTADGLYVEAGSAQGVRAGDVGIVRRAGSEIARVEVLATSTHSSRLRLLDGGPVEVGDTVVLRILVLPASRPPPEKTPEMVPESRGPFVPLLEKQARRAKTRAPANIFHGSLWVRQLVHFDGENRLDYQTTIAGSRGSVERLAGSPWTLRWNGNLSLRGGDAFSGSALEGARLDLFELSFGRRLEQGGFVQFGRLFPRALSGIGYLDGALIEMSLSNGWRAGGLLGFKPTRGDLTPSLDEPTLAAYATVERGKRRKSYYSATFGILASLFEGAADRTALLVEQHYERGSGLRIDSSAAIDLDVGAGAVRSGTRLSRFDLRAALRPTPALTLRTGIEHWERLDNRAERRDLSSIDPGLFDRGFWRGWIGGDLALTDKTRVGAEIALIDGEDASSDPHWQVSATRRDILALPGSSAALSIFNLSGNEVDGVGGRLTGYLPLSGGRWSATGSLGFRAFDAPADSFTATDVDLRLAYRKSARWSFQFGLSHAFGDSLDSTRVEAGFRLHW